MTTIKISALPAAGGISGSELVPVVQGGNTVKATVTQIVAPAVSIASSKVASVGATAPLASSGGLNPVISFNGVLSAANGGTGLASPGAFGQVLTSNGSNWISAPFTAASSQDYILQSYGIV